MLISCEEHLQALDSDKAVFLSEQRANIDKLHAYLEDKYKSLVAEYNESVENDLVNIRN